MKFSSSLSETELFLSSERRLPLLIALLLGGIVVCSAILFFDLVSLTSITGNTLVAFILLAALAVSGLVVLLVRQVRAAVVADQSQAYQTLESQVLERKRAEDTLRVQNEYFGALNEMSLALIGRLNLDELLADILHRAGELVGTKNGFVALLDREKNEMVLRVGAGVYQELVGSTTQPGTGFVGKAWQTGEAVTVDDYRNWSGRLTDPNRDVLRSVVGVPLTLQDQVLGVIGLARLEPNKPFDSTEMDILTRFASLAAIAMDNARLYESAQRELTQRQETELFLDSIVENLPTMLFVKEASALRFVRWNKAAEEIVKRPARELLGKNDYDFFPKEEADFFVVKDRETLSGGQIVDIAEEPIQTATDEVRWLHTKKFPVLGVEGKPAYLVGISEDITERKRVEAHAAFQNALLGAQFDLSPDGILVVSPADRILSFNRRFVEMWNIPTDAMTAGNTPALRQRMRDQLIDVEGGLERADEIYASPEANSRDEIEFKDGRIFERASSPIHSPSGEYLGRVWFFHDLTENRKREQDIRRIVTGTRAIFWRADVRELDDPTQAALGFDWVTQVSNADAAMQYLPFAMQEGQTYEDALYWATLEQDRAAMNQRSAEAFRQGHNGYTQEYRVIDANGMMHWMYEDARIRNLGGRHFEVVGVTTDVTDRRRAEEAVQKQNAYLNALQETSLGLMQRLDVNSLLQDIVARAGALLGTENGYVFLREPDGEEMKLRVGVGAYEGFVGRLTRRGVGLAGQVWETNALVVVDDYRTWTGRLSDASRDILRAVAGVPLRSENQVIGVIGLAYLDETRKFGEAEIQVLQRFAQLATIALDNARLYETAQSELEERARTETALALQLRETELINRTTNHAVNFDVDTALGEICRELATYFEVEQAGIALFSEDKQSLTVVADYSPASIPGVVGYVIPVQGNPSTEIVLATRRPAAFVDAQTDERLAAIHDLMETRGTASILIAPLFMRDEIIGTLGIDSYTRKEFTESDISLIEHVALSISTALENARLYRAAQQELAERARAERETRQRNQELLVLSRVSAVMTTNIDMQAALETLAREMVLTFNARNCGIALLNPDKTALTVVADALNEEHAEHAVGIVIPLEGNLSSQYVVENKRSLVIPDAQNDPMTEPIHERMRQRGTKCLAIIPLLAAGQVIGTIGLDTTDPEHLFDDQEIRLAETMANQMANAIEKQRLFDQTQLRAQETAIINEMAVELSAQLDSAQIFETAYRYLPRLMATEAFMAWLYNPATGLVTRPALYDKGEFYADEEKPRPPKSNMARVLKTGTPIFQNLTAEEWERERSKTTELLGSSDPSASLLYVPLRAGGRTLGVISAQTYKFNAYSEHDVQVFTSVATHIATALENARLLEQTQGALSESQTLYEISARLNASNTVQEILEAAAGPAIVESAFSASLASVALDEQGRPSGLQFPALWPRNSESKLGFEMRFEGEFIAGDGSWIENPFEPVLIQDINNDPRVNDVARAIASRDGVQSSALLPLKIGDRWVGLLTFHWQEPREFTSRDARMFRSVMAQAAAVLDNRSLFEQTQVALAQTQTALAHVREAQDRLNLQYQTANLLAESTSFGQVAIPLLELICAAFDWEMGEYWAVEENSNRIRLTYKWYRDDERIRDFVESTRSLIFGRGEGFAGRTWAQGAPIWVPDIYDSLGFNEIGIAKRAGLNSAVSFPLMDEAEIFGVMTFFSTDPQPQDDAVFTTMVGVGSQIGQFIQRRRAEQALRQQNAYLTALHDTALGLMSRRDLEELLQNIIARAGELIGTQHGYVHLVEPNGDELRMRVGIGIYKEFIGTRVKPGQGLAGTVWRDSEPIVVDDYRLWPGRLPMVDRDVLRAVVGVPLKSDNQTVGVLGLASLEEGRHFRAAQIEALNRFAELAAVALDNARLHNRSKEALMQTQRLAEREKASAEIADKLYAAPDVKSILQTAAEELRRNTGSRRAIVRLNLETKENGSHKNGNDEGDAKENT